MRYLLFFFIIIFSFHAHGQTKKTCTTDYFGDKHCTSNDGTTSRGTKDYFGDEIWTDSNGDITKCTTDYFGDKHCTEN